MTRKAFYEIEKAAYLFGKGGTTNPDRNKPEEAVRQWAAYELLRAYGIAISEIAFERPVRVGSKKYSIDILVSHQGVPFIVVECKLRTDAKAADGMAQAISYADAQNIQAEFAVYTKERHCVQDACRKTLRSVGTGFTKQRNPLWLGVKRRVLILLKNSPFSDVHALVWIQEWTVVLFKLF